MKRVEWASHVAAWKQSGNSVNSYGKPYRIPGKRLQWWNWFLKLEARAGRTTDAWEDKTPAPPLEFIPAHIRPNSLNVEIHSNLKQETATVEILVPSGGVIRATMEIDLG